MAYWTTPSIFLIWLFWYGVKSWFMADDFAWLALSQRVYGFRDFVQMMFEPMAQGTIRPWSERGFFLLFRTLFDLDALPYRVLVFATMALNLVLISVVTLRITRSRIAGFLAPVFWTVNEALVTVMTWNSSYNEAQCAAFLLTALLLFMRFAETGRRSYYFWCLAVFVLGFGALEINVVFPAIAAGFVLFVAAKSQRRSLLINTIPMWVISLLYYALHHAVAPFLPNGPYALHVDGRIVKTFLRYIKWSFIPSTWDNLHYRHWLALCILYLVAAGLFLYLVQSVRLRRWTPLFFLIWFLATIGPVIPLPDHISDYYLTIPTIGVAMLGACAVASAWQESAAPFRIPARVLACLAALAYFFGMLPVTRFGTHFWFERSRVVKGLVLGVRAAKQAHPGKAILLDGVTSDLYNDAIGHSPFLLLGASDVYLVPQLRNAIHPENDLAELDDTVLAPASTIRALTNEQAVVYSVAGDHLRNVTRTYGAASLLVLPQDEPRRIDVGNPLFSYLLGPQWLPLENGFRWMPKRATLRLGGPKSLKDQLYLEGSCPIQKLGGGSVHLEVTVDGVELKGAEISGPEGSFRRLFPLPSNLIGRLSVEVAIQTDRTTSTPSQGELGLAFGKIAIQ